LAHQQPDHRDDSNATTKSPQGVRRQPTRLVTSCRPSRVARHGRIVADDRGRQIDQGRGWTRSSPKRTVRAGGNGLGFPMQRSAFRVDEHSGWSPGRQWCSAPAARGCAWRASRTSRSTTLPPGAPIRGQRVLRRVAPGGERSSGRAAIPIGMVTPSHSGHRAPRSPRRTGTASAAIATTSCSAREDSVVALADDRGRRQVTSPPNRAAPPGRTRTTTWSSKDTNSRPRHSFTGRPWAGETAPRGEEPGSAGAPYCGWRVIPPTATSASERAGSTTHLRTGRG